MRLEQVHLVGCADEGSATLRRWGRHWHRVALCSATYAIFSVCALSACTTLSPSTQATAEQVRATRQYHEAIDISGRISVRYQQAGEQLLTGNFTWVQRPGRLAVTLLSPFGQTVARIEVEPGRATFLRGGQPPQVAADVDQLAAQALGWPLPVSGLQAWLQGFASVKGNPVAASSGGPTSLTSADGWQISYAAWTPDEAGNALRPRRIDLARRTEQAGDVEMRIVVDTWQPASPAQEH